MSKSAPDVNSRILLTDSPEKIASKIRSSVTDSIKGVTYDPIHRPGVSNLVTILAACYGQTPEDVAVAYANKTNAELKADVGGAVEALLQGPRTEFERLRNERGYLEQVARDGAYRARAHSEETMKQVRSMVGLH
jgi:tryptophanyl-tRNA synthetase